MTYTEPLVKIVFAFLQTTLLYSYGIELCLRNKLIIDNEKTNFILFHTVNKSVLNNSNSSDTDIRQIEHVHVLKNLGEYIEETFNYS